MLHTTYCQTWPLSFGCLHSNHNTFPTFIASVLVHTALFCRTVELHLSASVFPFTCFLCLQFIIHLWHYTPSAAHQLYTLATALSYDAPSFLPSFFLLCPQLLAVSIFSFSPYKHTHAKVQSHQSFSHVMLQSSFLSITGNIIFQMTLRVQSSLLTLGSLFILFVCCISTFAASLPVTVSCDVKIITLREYVISFIK